MRSVLVTGGTGYLGSAIVRRLSAEGEHVQVLARSSAGADAAPLRHVADLTDERSIHGAFREAARIASSSGLALDVIHCAALISYRSRDAAELPTFDRARLDADNLADPRARVPGGLSPVLQQPAEFRLARGHGLLRSFLSSGSRSTAAV